MIRRPEMLDFMIDDPLGEAVQQNSLKMHDVVLFLWRRWLLIAIIFVGVVALNIALLLQIQPRYTATAEMTLVDPLQQSTPIADLLTGVPLSRQMVEQEMTTMRSKAFMIEVAKRLQVDADSPMLSAGGPPPLPTRILGSVKSSIAKLLTPVPQVPEASLAPSEPGDPSLAGEQPIPDNATGLETDPAIDPDADPDAMAEAMPNAGLEGLEGLAGDAAKYGPAADLLAGRLTISQLGNGYSIGLSAEAGSPEDAARIANIAAVEYTQFSLSIRSAAIEEQVQLLSGRVDELGRDLEEAETAVVEFQSRLSGAHLGNTDRLAEQIDSVGRSVLVAQTDVAKIESQRREIADLVERKGAVAAAAAIESPLLSDLREQLSQQRIERSRVLQQFGEGAYQVAGLDAVIARIEDEVAIEVARVSEELDTRLNIAQNVVASVETQLSTLEETMQQRSRSMVELAKLRRIADANRIAYEEFLKVATESAQIKALQQPSVRLLSYAEVPTSPSSPRTLLRTALAGVSGLLIGLGVAVLLELSNNNIKTSGELRRVTGLPVIGSVPKLRKSRAQRLFARPDARVEDLPKAERALVEEGRKIALFLSTVVVDGGTILFTSAVPREGKDTVAMLVARSLAARDHSVILVDAAHDRGARGALTSERIGPVEKADQPEVANAVVTRSAAGFDVMSIAAAAKTDLARLPDKWTADLVRNLSDRYDYVLVETAPVLSLGNVTSFLRHADALVVAFQWNATARQAVQACLLRLRDISAKNVYVVMTQVVRRKERKYEYRGFGKTVTPWWGRV